MRNSAYQGKASLTALPVLIFLALSMACTAPNTAQNSANSASKDSNTARIAEKLPINASDDAEELAKIIKLPFQPDEVMWHVETGAEKASDAAGANRDVTLNDNTPVVRDDSKRRLIAVLKFNEEGSAKLTELAGRLGPAVDASIAPEGWFPPNWSPKATHPAIKA